MWFYCSIGVGQGSNRGSNETYARPAAFDVDYGVPVGGQLCKETGPGSGVFEREYTKAHVQHDCASGKSTITMKGAV